MIDSFRIVNKTGITIGANVYLFQTANPAVQVSIAPSPINLDARGIYEETKSIVLLPTEQIKVEVQVGGAYDLLGGVDYDFTIKNLNVDEE